MSKNPSDLLAELFPTPKISPAATLLPDSDYAARASAVEIPVSGQVWKVFPLHKLANLAVEILVESALPQVQEGGLVEIYYAGKKTKAWVLERTQITSVPKALPQVLRVITAKPLLTPALWDLLQQLAKRNGGGLNNLLAQAIPPRKAQVEKQYFASLDQQAGVKSSPVIPLELPAIQGAAALWERYRGGSETLARLRRGEKSRCYWQALPDPQRQGPPYYQLAALVQAAQAEGGSVLVLFPTQEQVEEFINILLQDFQADPQRVLPYYSALPERYRNFLRARFEQSLIVVGVSGAIYLPLADLKMIVIWDDGADSYQMRSFPYLYARQGAVLRKDSSLVLAGYATSVYTGGLIEKSWLVEVNPLPQFLREHKVYTPSHENRPGDETPFTQRIPSSAWQLMRSGLKQGAVLVQIPQIANKHSFYCRNCQEIMRCERCTGPLTQAPSRPQHSYQAQTKAGTLPSNPDRNRLQCRSCHHQQDSLCLNCGSLLYQEYVRRSGLSQTAQQLAQALQVKVEVSYAQNRLDQVDASQSLLVLATAGAEPKARNGGYRAGVLLDGEDLLAFDQIWVQEEALRRWANALALVNGPAMVLGNIGQDLADTLRAGTYPQWARSEYQRRELLGLPPAWVMLQLQGPETALNSWWEQLQKELGQIEGIRWLPPVPAATGAASGYHPLGEGTLPLASSQPLGSLGTDLFGDSSAGLAGVPGVGKASLRPGEPQSSSAKKPGQTGRICRARVLFPPHLSETVGEKCQSLNALATRKKWGKVKVSMNETTVL